MRWIVTTESMREADRYCIEKLQIPGSILMETAARSVVDRMKEMLRRQKANIQAQKVLVLCGSGNNGGDGFAIARMLKILGMTVRVFMNGEVNGLTEEAHMHYDMLSAYQISVFDQSQASVLEKMVDQSDWVIDALFGTGLDREIQGLLAQVIDYVNKVHARGHLQVISVDIPSGIAGDSGQVLGCALQADETVTFCRLKPGLILFPGRDYAGHVTVANIGIPDSVPSLKEARQFMLEPADIQELLPKRMSRSHKGLYGHLLSVSGSASMPGAAVLSGCSAYKMGTGLVDIAIPQEVASVVQVSLPEAITVPYEPGHTEWVRGKVQVADAVLAGPGLGRKPYVKEMLKELLWELPQETPLVLDADALNWMAQEGELAKMVVARSGKAAAGNTILTPHLGEAARLLSCSIKEIMQEPVQAATSIAERYHSVVVLKDAMTLVYEPDGLLFYNNTGNNGMSTAGSGDVLAGMIAALCAEGFAPFKAAYAGVYLHGAAGDLARTKKGLHGLRASDIAKSIHLEKIQKRIAKEKEACYN